MTNKDEERTSRCKINTRQQINTKPEENTPAQQAKPPTANRIGRKKLHSPKQIPKASSGSGSPGIQLLAHRLECKRAVWWQGRRPRCPKYPVFEGSAGRWPSSPLVLVITTYLLSPSYFLQLDSAVSARQQPPAARCTGNSTGLLLEKPQFGIHWKIGGTIRSARFGSQYISHTTQITYQMVSQLVLMLRRNAVSWD